MGVKVTRRRALVVIGLAGLLVVGGGALAVRSAMTPERPPPSVTLDTSKASEPADPLDEAQALLESGQLADARSALTAHLEKFPSDASAIVLLGRVEIADGDPAQATALIRQAVEAEPENADFHYWLGSSLGQEAMSAGPLAQASLGLQCLNHYKQAVELDPDHLDARTGLLFFYMMAPSFIGGGLDKARAQADEITRIDAFQGHLAHARIEQRDGNVDGAVARLDEASALRPDDPDALVQRARLLHDMDRNEEAFDACRRLIELGEGEGHYQLARIAARTGEHPDEGLASLDAYLGLPSRDVPEAHVWYRYGQLHAHKGETDEARASFERALELMPSLTQARDELNKLPG